MVDKTQMELDERMGADMCAAWVDQGHALRSVGALVRLVREAIPWVEDHFEPEKWPDSKAEAVSWLAEAKALVGEVPDADS